MIALPLRLTKADARLLEREAQRRGTQPAMLARRVISAVVRDQLYDAVIDDGANEDKGVAADEEARIIKQLMAALGGDVEEAMRAFAEREARRR
jgi:hypothetical protein